jgi:hypothetical protein
MMIGDVAEGTALPEESAVSNLVVDSLQNQPSGLPTTESTWKPSFPSEPQVVQAPSLAGDMMDLSKGGLPKSLDLQERCARLVEQISQVERFLHQVCHLPFAATNIAGVVDVLECYPTTCSPDSNSTASVFGAPAS